MTEYESHGGTPSETDIIVALAKAFDAPESAAIAWLAGLKVTFDPKAATERLVERDEVARRRGRQRAWLLGEAPKQAENKGTVPMSLFAERVQSFAAGTP